jgi:hypothetical protein
VLDISEPVIPTGSFFLPVLRDKKREERMQGNLVDRHAVLKSMSAAAVMGAVAAQPQRASAQQVKW